MNFKFEKPLTIKQRQDRWGNYINMRLEYIQYANNNGVNKELIELLTINIVGGTCPLCDQVWEKICFNNIYLEGEYFVPDCWCYIKCPRCKDFLYEEQLNKKIRINDDKDMICPSCGWFLIFDGNKRHGKTREIDCQNEIKKGYWPDNILRDYQRCFTYKKKKIKE